MPTSISVAQLVARVASFASVEVRTRHGLTDGVWSGPATVRPAGTGAVANQPATLGTALPAPKPPLLDPASPPLPASPSPGGASAPAAAPSATVDAGAPVSEPAAISNQGLARLAVSRQMRLTMKDKLDLEVQTREGDKVRLELRQRVSYAEREGLSADGDGIAYSTQARFSARSRFELRVDGDLNQEETAALNSLFSDVLQLADTFHGGDLEAALADAAALGNDSEQIVSFSLRLRQKETLALREQYRLVQEAPPEPSLADRLGPVGGYVEQLVAMKERASLDFEAGGALVRHLVESVNDGGPELARLHAAVLEED